MKHFFKYKYMRYNTRKLLVVLILFHIIVIASVPMILLLNTFFPQQKDKSATFTLYYDTPDPDFGTIAFISSTFDYSGIQYFLDGVPYYTDSSGIIQHYFNDNEWHNLTLLWHGVLYEYTFNSSITEDIVLATKSIDATAYWDEIFVPAYVGVDILSLDLLYFDGTSWIVIENFTAVENGMIQFNNLVMGLYALSEAGDMNGGFNFTIDQTTITYTNDIFVVPDKTIIDIEYLDSIFGADYPVDLSTIIYQLQAKRYSGDWVNLSEVPQNYVMIVIDSALGTITIYELWSGTYRIFIENSWDTYYDFLRDELTKINLVAKSLEASIVWSLDSTPVIDMMVPLYFFDGIEYVFVANYLTDFEGKIYLTNLMPTGDYKLGMTEFSIIANDTVKTIECIVESLFWRREPHLDSNRDIEFKYFLFFMLQLKLRGIYHD